MRVKWYLCPICSGNLLKYREDTVLRNFPAYCKHCRQESLITIKNNNRAYEPNKN